MTITISPDSSINY